MLRCISLEALGLLRVSGTKASEFLQGQLSCDVREVSATQSRIGVHCNAKGRVLATFHLFYREPYYYLLLPFSMVQLFLKDLRKYAIFSKVTLEDVSQTYQKVGLVGDYFEKNSIDRRVSHPLEKNEVYSDESATLLSITSTVPCAILLSTDALKETIPDTPKEPFSYWQNIAIENGIACVYPETRGLFTPHHLDYHQLGGISFTKGCYTGQEVVARMHYLGKLKQALYKASFNSIQSFLPGTDIVDSRGDAQGKLVMIAQTSNSHTALVLLQNSTITQPLYCENTLLQNIQKAHP